MRRTPSLRRMHYREDGRPKKALSMFGAEEARKKGYRTYLCPVCGKTHCTSQEKVW